MVVTGASSGIGFETALAFAARGDTVFAVARRTDRLERLIEACGRNAPDSGFLPGDLGETAFVDRVVPEALSRHGRIDVLVNNAAQPRHEHVFHLEPDAAEQVMRVNYLAAMRLTLAALPAMRARGSGHVVNVSSFAAQVTPPREAAYAASKAALSAFTAGLWTDLAGSGVHASLVVPGAIDTEIWNKSPETPAYAGPRLAPERVAQVILEAVDRRHLERTVPRRPALFAARLLRALAPRLLVRGMNRMEPGLTDRP